MQHIHRAETWRHPETKARAVLWKYVPGRMTGASVDYFKFRERAAFCGNTFASLEDARQKLRELGYQHERGAALSSW